MVTTSLRFMRTLLLSMVETSAQVGKRELLYIFFMGCAAALGLIRTIVFGAYLSPSFMGYYAIAVTIAMYGTFLQLGLMSGLNRELPVSLGSRGEQYSSNLVGETTVAVFSLQLIGIILYGIILANLAFADLSVRKALLLGGLLAFSSTFDQMVMLRLRAEQRILSFSLLQVVTSLVVLILGVIAVQHMGYQGAILSLVFVNFLSFAIMSTLVLRPVNYRYFRPKDLIYLLRIGLPMMIAGILVNLQLTMDRLFLIRNASAAAIGIYQIGILPLTLGLVTAGIVNQYISPKLLFRYGQGENLQYVFNKSVMVSFMMIGTMLLFFPLVSPVASFIINRWLPDYRDSVSLISIFYLGAIFTSANVTGIAIQAANRQILYLYGTAFVACMCFFGYLFISYYHMTIHWYAYVNVAAQILSFLLITGISYYLTKKAMTEAVL